MYIEEERHHAVGRTLHSRWSREFSNLFEDETKHVTWPLELMLLFGKKLCDVILAKGAPILLPGLELFFKNLKKGSK